MHNLSRHEKEIWLIGLYFKCPISDKIPTTCNMICLRKVNYAEFIKKIKEMSDQEINELLNNHFSCENNKSI